MADRDGLSPVKRGIAHRPAVHTGDQGGFLVSIIVPVFNEEAMIDIFLARLLPELERVRTAMACPRLTFDRAVSSACRAGQ